MSTGSPPTDSARGYLSEESKRRFTLVAGILGGAFFLLVGVLLVALTENWQRLGDLAARTVVVVDERPA